MNYFIFCRQVNWRGAVCFALVLALSRHTVGQFEYGLENTTQNSVLLMSALQFDFASRVTQTLNQLLYNYNNLLRPQHGGPPTVVNADLFVRSMGPVSEGKMTYSMDAYFRQTWVDERLRFSGDINVLVLHIKLLHEIWKPDTYFYNGQGSYVHMTTTPNKLLRIKQDGSVLYSMRITIKATCPMYLSRFPMDEQFCPLRVGSYAYTNNDVVYKWWKGEKSVSTSAGMRLSQFDLRGLEVTEGSEERLIGNFSTLEVRFQLERQLGYFIIQVYVPCTLVVVLSWVSFWLHREATADRVGLGVTAFLTLTTMSLETNSSLPQARYGTYLDWFFIVCFCFVIGSLLEFAGVHYFTKFDYGEQAVSDTEEGNEDDKEVGACALVENEFHNFGEGRDEPFVLKQEAGGEKLSDIRDGCCIQFFRCLQSNIKYKKQMVVRGLKRRRGQINSVSAIDKAARFIFPISFTILTTLYWVRYYL